MNFFWRKSNFFFTKIGLILKPFDNYENVKYYWLKEYQFNQLIDIGANIGQFASEFRKIYPKTHIVSFEPISNVYQQLADNFKFDTYFSSLNFGLGDADETLQININSNVASSSILELNHFHKEAHPTFLETTKESIRVAQLDTLLVQNKFEIKDNCFVKIDVQGYEDRVIRGGKQALSKAKMVMIETSFEEVYKNLATYNTIVDLMKEIGFRVLCINQVAHQKKDGKPLYADVYFVK